MSSVLCTDGNEHRTHGWSKSDACEVPFILEATGCCVSHDNLYIHSHMFTDKPQLTSLLVSFCRINYVCCRFQELKKMECFFLSIRSSISHTYAWPVFYHAPSPKQALPCGWDMLFRVDGTCSYCTLCLSSLSLHSNAIMFTAYLKSLMEGVWKVYSDNRLAQKWFEGHALKVSWVFSLLGCGGASARVQRETPRSVWSPHPNWKPPD